MMEQKQLIKAYEPYSIILTVFYISYSLLEVPSNYCLKRFGPSVCTLKSRKDLSSMTFWVVLMSYAVEMDRLHTVFLGGRYCRFKRGHQLCHCRSHPLPSRGLRGW